MKNHLSANPIVAIVCGALFLVVALTTTTVQCFPDTGIQDAECSKETWPPSDPNIVQLDFVLSDLVEYTSQEVDYTFNTGTANVFGYAKCERHLSPNDCMLCVEEAVDFLEKKCSFSIRGEVVMVDCRVRYSDQSFY